MSAPDPVPSRARDMARKRMAGEKNNREDPGEKDLKAEGHGGHDKKNEQFMLHPLKTQENGEDAP